jgi:GH35 family endo-1,4-beta-xylanase
MNILNEAKANIEKFRKGLAIIKTTPNAKIKLQLIKHKFLFGGSIDPFFDDRDKEYLKKFAELFNYATTENIFKWGILEPEEGEKQWKDSDKLIDWFFKNNITVKGHALAWGHKSGMPKWLNNKTRGEIEKLQLQRIKDILERYKDKIDYYEVVNEPTRALLFDNIINDFTEKCMKVANKVTNAKLIFNGNKLFLKDGGKEKFKKFIEKMIKKGIKFDGIGIQAHRPITRRIPNEEMWGMIEYFALLGKSIHITEFMIQDMKPEEQVEYYKEIYTICFGNPNVEAITTWAISDDRSCVPYSGLLDKNLKEKPVYKQLKELIHKEWSTKEEDITDSNGIFKFRGFYGDYKIEINGKILNFKLERDEQKIEI